MVREVATSDKRFQLVIAPAGTGKTKSMEALARAWKSAPGHRVVGLAPTARASAVLREDLGTVTDNVAKLNHLIWSAGKRQQAGQDIGVAPIPAELVERAATQVKDTTKPPSKLAEWFTSLGPGTLVVLDEAGMVSTPALDAAVGYLMWAGADVVAVGDTKQLPAVQSGGVLTDIAAEYGAMTLSHVVRFTDRAEGPASLALRNGDEAALGFYADKGRVHSGESVAVVTDGYEAWRTDVAAGADSILLAYGNETVTDLNARARQDRLGGADPGVEVELSDGLRASDGDTISTRHNERRLPLNAQDWVRNGDRWVVESAREDGSFAGAALPVAAPGVVAGGVCA